MGSVDATNEYFSASIEKKLWYYEKFAFNMLIIGYLHSL
jgi:hypothetical protein